MASKLEVALPTDREIVITRSFDAPRALVWDCHTKAEFVRRWMLGPPGWEMPVCDIDLRVGGKYRYEWAHKDRGAHMGMGGVFREVSAPEMLRSEEKFDDDWTGGETNVSQALDEQSDRTYLTMTILYASKEARDGAAGSGMTGGIEQGYARLDEMLSVLR